MVKKQKSLNPSQEEDAPKKKQRSTAKNTNKTLSETGTEACRSSCFKLPLDIVAIILSSLPAKSLAKFRCVCKEWLSLTQDPRFLKSHHQRSSSHIIIDKRVVGGEVQLYVFSTGGGGELTNSTSKFNLGRKYYTLTNSVDGLTCAYATAAKSNIYLLNPATLEIRKLPMNNGRRKCFVHESFSLGLDMTLAKYKVVRLFSCPKGLRFLYEIYNVGATRWRCLGEAPFQNRYNSDPVFLQGALYWLGVTRDDNQLRMFRLDIKDEKFGPAISTPSPSFSHIDLCCLKESRGKLRLVFNNPAENSFEIWAVKDYLNDTWVKEYMFHGSSIPSFVNSYDVIDIVNGEIHFRISKGREWHIICYNPYSGALRKLFVGGENCGNFATHRESLISP